MEVLSGNVIYSGSTYNNSCIQVCSHTNLNTVLENMIDTFCSTVSAGKIKITSTDDCPGYIKDKLTSQDNSVTFQTYSTGVNCQTLDLSVESTKTVLYNLQSTITRTTTGDFGTYTLPANGLVTNGDQLVIDVRFNVSSATGGVTLNLIFDTVTLQSFSISSLNLTIVKYLKMSTSFSRLSGSNVQWETEITLLDANEEIMQMFNKMGSSGIVNLSNTNVIKGNLSAIGGGNVKEQYLTVKLFKI